MKVVRSRNVLSLALLVLLSGALAVALATFESTRGKAPDFPEACATGSPYYVASSFRAQSSRGRNPDPRAPSVVLFADTPDDRPQYTLATFNDIGSIWGLGYSQPENAVYASTYHKRGVPYGPEGIGAIYRIALASGDISHFVTVPDAGNLNRRPGMANGERDYDDNAARQVGKIGLGDLEISPDGSELFVVNLNDRRIYRYALPSGTALGDFDHGAASEGWQRHARPFGLAFNSGWLYHGVVNSRGTGASLKGYVYRSRPDGSEMELVSEFPLNYRRDSVRLRTVRSVRIQWSPWTDANRPPSLRPSQPMLTDLEVAADGSIAVALRDRRWDQEVQWVDETRVTQTVIHAPQQTPVPPTPDIMSERGLGFGDLLRGERPSETAEWIVVGDPEHYDDTNAINHNESALGAVACVPDTDLLVSTHYGVKSARSDLVLGEEGVYFYDAPSGNKTQDEALGNPAVFEPYTDLVARPDVVHADTFVEIRVVFEFFRDIGSLGDVEALCAGNCWVPDPTPTEVEPPTATPTVTPSPPPTEPPPTATTAPEPAYLPVVLGEDCDPQLAKSDIVLVLDASSSMTGAKIASAKAAAKTFVGEMNLPADRVGVVSFNIDAQVETALEGDVRAVETAIDAIAVSPGTRIDTGLEAGADVLAERRPNATAVLVLLTDGIQAVEVERPHQLADALRADGVELFVIGLGADVDVPYLARLASEPDRLFLSPTPDDLADIYGQIARVIPCPRDAFWGRR